MVPPIAGLGTEAWSAVAVESLVSWNASVPDEPVTPALASGANVAVICSGDREAVNETWQVAVGP